MAFTLTAKIGADGSGWFRELNKVDRSQAALEAKIAARNLAKLDHQGKLNQLRKDELALANKAFELAAKGDKDGAAKATLAAIEKREHAERLVAEEKLRQQKIQDETAAKAAKAAEQSQRQSENLAREQQRLLAVREADAKKAEAYEQSRRQARLNLYKLETEELRKQAAVEKQRSAAAAANTFGARVKAGASGAGGSLLQGFGAPLGAAAAGVGIAALTRKTVEYGGQLTDLSGRIGVGTSALQELDFAMKQNGATLDDATGAMQKLGQARQEALDGNKEMADAFAALGIGADQLRAARLEDLFKAIGRSVRDAADVQTVLADAVKVMGKGSGAVIPAMRADLEAAADEARRLGLVIGEDTVAKLDELGDKADSLSKRMMGLVAPVILFVSEGVNKLIDGFEIFQSVFARTFEMFAAIKEGVPIRQALAEADAGFAADITEIADRQAARQATAAGRAAGGALDLSGDGAVSSAAKILALRERIEKLDRDALQGAERRAALEAEIASLRQEQANLAANGLDEVRQLELDVKARGLEKELAAMDKGDKSAGPSRDRDRQLDSLGRVGIFMGGAPVGIRTTPLTGEQAQRLNSSLVRVIQSTQAQIVAAVNNGTRTTKEVLG